MLSTLSLSLSLLMLSRLALSPCSACPLTLVLVGSLYPPARPRSPPFPRCPSSSRQPRPRVFATALLLSIRPLSPLGSVFFFGYFVAFTQLPSVLLIWNNEDLKKPECLSFPFPFLSARSTSSPSPPSRGSWMLFAAPGYRPSRPLHVSRNLSALNVDV